MLSVSGLTFYLRNAEDFSRLTVALTWMFSLVLVPAIRAVVREIGSRSDYWGNPVVIIGFGRKTVQLVKYLKANKKIGLRPVLILNGYSHVKDPGIDIPILHAVKALDDEIASRLSVRTSVLVASEVPKQLANDITRRQIGGFRHVILVPDLQIFQTIGVSSIEMGYVLGLRARYNLHNRWDSILKLIIDQFLALILAFVSLPVILVIALLIKLDSSGPVLFTQERIGKDGRTFYMLKFRTMVRNADEVLKAYLASDPRFLAEWEMHQKLKNDPRITRIGKILRRLSLDELPQVWNVLDGKMSLVGPRPIIADEIQKYGDRFEFYRRVKPGITGLWQVSGRNDMSYAERVARDEYYVRNWSVWLDITILARTLVTVINQNGAY
jgi:Undecaprenyl-phosphate galactose phosphotransferase WbaP